MLHYGPFVEIIVFLIKPLDSRCSNNVCIKYIVLLHSSVQAARRPSDTEAEGRRAREDGTALRGDRRLQIRRQYTDE